MNGEPFYDNSTQRWRPPSPKSTPQSAKFASFPVDPSYATSIYSPEQHYGWMTSHTPLAPSLERPLQPRGSFNQIVNHVPTVPSQAGQPEFPSGSFVEHFSSTTLDDPFTESRVITSATPASQMRTPPPTRDDSNRRKSHQPRVVEFQTPSTIASRRVPPQEGWQGQPPEVSYPAPSPFTFTPLQFSPSSQFGFTPSGPMTAPVYPQSAVFWEPNTSHAMTQMSFSTIAEEPYGNSFGIDIGGSGSQYVFGTATPLNNRIPASESLQAQTAAAYTVPRPQSARPADNRGGVALAKNAFNSSTTGVDPTMLWNPRSSESSAILNQGGPSASKTGTAEDRQAYQPYQHQLESLRAEKKEKEQVLKTQRATLGTPTLEIPGQNAQSSLRRSLTDGKARGQRNPNRSASYAGVSDSHGPSSSQTVQLHRESSPLKRHRSISQVDQLTPTKARARRSIVLTVDEQGNARTEVRQLGDDSTSTPVFSATRSQDGFSDSSDVSDSASRPAVTVSSSESSPGPSDAQNALREIVRSRRLSRRSEAVRHSIQSGSDINDTVRPQQQRYSASSYSSKSPTTITDPEFFTPTTDRTMDISRGIRCVCEGRASENLTVECESCKHWLHVSCLGITPEQIPPVFICVFCTGSNSAAKGRVRSYSNSNFRRFSGQFD